MTKSVDDETHGQKMTAQTPIFRTYFAETADDVVAAQKLRHDVFVKELGANGHEFDRAECDAFDSHASHLLLVDERRAAHDRVVGVYRVMNKDQADKAGGFSSAGEYDLSPLISSGRKLLELGRSCVHADYRGGMALFHLWRALGAYVEETKTQVLFGVASFHGTNLNEIAMQLALLHRSYLAPVDLRTTSLKPAGTPAMAEANACSDKSVMASMPPLIKAYLRIGGVIGQGAFIDYNFNTTDVCMIVDVDQMKDVDRLRYAQGQR